jgi:glycosyltransferase involved in cell wall biosynthesis
MTPAEPEPISVAICCFNAARTIEAACRSVAWADEIVVVDSGSTDDTAQIARRFAHRFVEEPWRGYTAQKAYAASLCRHEWVFVLDADETCSPELAAEWRALGADERAKLDLLVVPRRNWILGREVRSWRPDLQNRIIRRDAVAWADQPLHDSREADPARTRRLRGWIEHKRVGEPRFSDYFSGRRMDERLMLVAGHDYARGKRCRWWDAAFRPPMAFIKFYLLRAGFRDGLFGLLIAQKAFVSTQLKYAALWSLQQSPADAPATPPQTGEIRDGRPITGTAEPPPGRRAEAQESGENPVST